MTTLPFTAPAVAGAASFTYTGPTGFALLRLRGAGGGGEGGTGLTRGGTGGGEGALVVDRVFLVSGTTYNYSLGSPGTGGAYGGGNGADGGSSWFDTNTSHLAAGGKGGALGGGQGGAVADSIGSSRQAGADGEQIPGSGNFNGGFGGGVGGGLGGISGDSHGKPGTSDGGGGGGGYQSSGAVGGDGYVGGLTLTAASSQPPGYYAIGVTFASDGTPTYQGPGTYDDTVPADGKMYAEASGSGAGARGGNGGALQGGAGAGGGAYAAKTLTVFGGTLIRRIVPAAGTGAAFNSAAATDGATATITLTPLRISNKVLTSNVATLTTYHPTLSQTQKHGFVVGDSVVVAGVDATFNGTVTVTAVSADRSTFSYAVTHANVTSTPVTPAGTSVGLTTPWVLADKGLHSTGTTTGAGLGGRAANSIGDVTVDAEDGVLATTSSTAGGTGGACGLPWDGLGGLGGHSGSTAGLVGVTPGGGGGGGAGLTGGNGANGAPGAATLRYILRFGVVTVNGQGRAIVNIFFKDNGGTVRTIVDSSVIRSGVKVDTRRVLVDPTAGLRRKPAYIPGGYEDRFDITTGTFNFASVTHVGPALRAGYFEWLQVGDSVSDGSTHLDAFPGLNYTLDYPDAYPRKAREQLAAAKSVARGGTGLIRPANVASTTAQDPMWTLSNFVKPSSHTGDHYVQGTASGAHATLDTSGPGIKGTSVAVVTVGPGVMSVSIDGVSHGNTASGATSSTINRFVVNGLSDATHSVLITRVSGTCIILGADVYYPATGIKVHDVAQGGSSASFKSGDSSPQQYCWADTAPGVPASMAACYSQYSSMFGVTPHAVVIMLGGNDAFEGIADSVMSGNMASIVADFQASGTDVILFPDTHDDAAMGLLMQVALTANCGLIDFYWLSRDLRTIFGKEYNGDTFGHLNSGSNIYANGTGWAAGLLANALLAAP